MLEAKEYLSSDEKRRDRWLGVLGWIVINGLLLGLTAAEVPNTVFGDPNATGTVGVVVLIANVGALILLGLVRKYLAYGALTAMGGLLGISIVFGVISQLVCSTNAVGH